MEFSDPDENPGLSNENPGPSFADSPTDIQTQEQSDIREDEYRDDIKHKVEMGLLKMCSQCPDFFSTENVILLHFSVDRVPLFKSSESNQCITLAHSL